MSLSPIQKNICQKLNTELTIFVNGVEFAYTAVSSVLNLIKTTISGMIFTATDILNKAAADVDAGLSSVIPSIPSEYSEILAIIKACPYLRNDKTLSDPLGMIRSLGGSIQSDAQNIFKDLTSSLAEFNVGKLMDSLFVRYADEFKFGDIIPNIYTIIDCIDAICPDTDIESTVLSFEKYVTKLYLLTNGTFDKITFYDELKLQASQASNIDIALASYADMRKKVNDSISSGVNYAKSLL